MASILAICALLLLILAVAIPVSSPIILRMLSRPFDPEIGKIELQDAQTVEKSFRFKKVLVVGGTRGIGRGIALTLAKYGAHVRVAGRNGGDKVVAQMEKIAPYPETQRFQAYSSDLLTIKGVNALTDELREDKYKMDYLIMTVGTWPHATKPLNSEGLNKVIALDIMARVTIIKNCAQILKKNAKVLSILASTMMDPPMVDVATMKDVITGDKKDPSLYTTLSTAAIGMDALLYQASKKLPEFYFIGTNPGIVETDLQKDTFPAWVNKIKAAVFSVLPVTLSEDEVGELHAQILASPNAQSRKVTFFNQFLEGRETYTLSRDEEFAEWLWKFCRNHATTYA